MRHWVLLNMETPKKKPASSRAKRARGTESAATSLERNEVGNTESLQEFRLLETQGKKGKEIT